MRGLAAAILIAAAAGASAQTAPLLQVVPELAALDFEGLVAGPKDIAKVEAFTLYDRPALSITLTEALSPLVAEMTKGRIGERLTIRVCGAVVSEPLLQAELTGPEFLLTGLTPESASTIERALRTGSCEAPPVG